MSNDISNRRHSNNVFFLSLHTLLVSGLTIFIGNIDLVSPSKYLILTALVAGIAFSIFWQLLIKSYKQLNKAKFDVIHLLESKLPANCFYLEWQIIQKDKGYKQFTETELNIPKVFIGLYIIMGLFVLFA
jgi:hypothetical protein